MPDPVKTPTSSTTHLVLIPSYNPGPRVIPTVRAALDEWSPVWVIVDGSTDGSARQLHDMAAQEPALRVFIQAQNRGKGAAVLTGLKEARRQGFTHALTMDSDGQHPADMIQKFMQLSSNALDTMVLGNPIFDASAPAIRIKGRKLSNWWTNVETLRAGVGDSLFGFRVYPIAPLIAIMRFQPFMRRFDFDVEAVVRLCWAGIRPVNVRAPVRYFRPEDGGVSHFNYWRTNAVLIWMHARLMAGFLLRLPILVARRARELQKPSQN